MLHAWPLTEQTHPLLDDESALAQDLYSADDIGLASRQVDPVIFDEDDADLAPWLIQLQSHLDSIKANTEQIPALEEEMMKTQDALKQKTAAMVT